jgi:integrase
MIEGKRRQISTGTSNIKFARQILEKVHWEIISGKFGIVDQAKAITLSAFFEKYFADARTLKRPAVIVNELNYSRKFIAILGDRQLSSIDLETMTQWRSELLRLRDDGKRISNTTYNIERRFLHAAFNKAISWGYLKDNPVTDLKMLPVEERRNFLKDEEIKRIFELIDADIADPNKRWNVAYNRRFRLFVEFLLHTGLRRSEALNLRPEHIDLDKGVIYVEKTKSKKSRPIPLNPRAKALLIQAGDDLFSALSVQTVSHKFNDLLKRLGIQGLKLHSLRHTFATRLVQCGADIYAVKELLGHADIRTSMVYAKANVETLRAAVERLTQ